MMFDPQDWDNKAFRSSEESVARLKRLYDRLIRESSILALSVRKTDKPFSFSDYPLLRDKANKLFKKYAADTEINISKTVAELWDLANQKSDSLIDQILERYTLIRNRYRAYGEASRGALKAFQERKSDGMDLSARVWRNTQQVRQELELALDVGLKDGISAANLSRSVRRYLNDPDRLYRRVRDERGELRLSQKAKAYHPGQGVYRSSYKNAIRLTRTETNMAYRTADHLRWSTMDFVSGIQVKLSNNPNHCPVCVQLQGKYPKDFKFIGWHPQCRCYAVPALISNKQFDKLELALLNDEDVSDFAPNSQVKGIPAGMKNWIKENKERAKSWKSLPYFVRDNPDYIPIDL